jgi:hypothetical protein
MKRLVPLTLAAALVTGLAASSPTDARAEALPPGQVDFGNFTPSDSGGEFVEVNLPSNLITLAAQLVQKQEPEVAKVLNGLKSVRVHVIGMDDKNRGDLEKRAKRVRDDLAKRGWERIVTAIKDEQDVGVYLKMDGKSAVQGLTVVVLEGKKQAVFVNVVGDIRPEQLAMLGERLHIDPLQKVGHLTEKKEEPANTEKAEKSEN